MPEPGAARRRLRGPSSLRARLVLGVVVLTLLGLAVADVAGLQALRSNQLARIDQGLGRAALLTDRPRPADRDGGGQTPYAGAPGAACHATRGDVSGAVLPRQAAAQVFLAFDAEGVACTAPQAAVASTLAGPKLPRLTAAVARAHAGRPFTVGSTGAGTAGDWRVLVQPLADGRGSRVFAQSLRDLQQTTESLLLIDAAAGGAVLLLLAVGAILVVRLGLRPLRAVAETADAIRAGDLRRRSPVADTRTEVGRLGSAFNSMLAQIETAFDQSASSTARLRQFAADASHELRTPLTSIRGFAELYRHGAVAPGPDLDRMMGRIEDEAIRMGGLVEDLLLLARLDQGRPLQLGRVDLRRLADDALHDALAVEPGRPVRLVGPRHVLVDGDEDQLRQVLTNLLANARVHTPPGTPVTVTVGADGGAARIVVADEGPGMAPEDAAHVFDRFWRADRARTREHGGAGLGLSIVAAIVAAHHGRVGVTSAVGAGAAFTVELPVVARVGSG